MKVAPLSIMMVLDSMGTGGTETHVISLAGALTRSGHKVSVVSADGELHRQFEEAGCSVHLVPDWGITVEARLKVRDKLLEVISDEGIQCIHGHQTPSGLQAASVARIKGIPFVFTAHGTYYPRDQLRMLLAQSKSVISVSEPVAHYIRQLGFQSDVIPNGIDLTQFYPADRSPIRSKIGIAEDTGLILYASRLAWGKATACDTMLRAMKDLYRNGWNKLHLVVAGNGPQYGAIKQLADFIHFEIGHTLITLVGQQSQMLDYYHAADIVVGSGRVALEALACEKPVLAMGNHGYFGWVAPDRYDQAWSHYFGDHGSIAPCSRYRISADIADGYRNLESLKASGREGRRWVERDFHIECSMKRVLSIYQSAIAIMK